MYPNDSSPSPRHDPHPVRFLTTTDDYEELVREVTDLVTFEYRVSDTGINLNCPRLRTEDICRMVEDGEILMAIEDEGQGDGDIIIGFI